MTVIGTAHMESFLREHPELRAQVAAWRCEVEAARWETSSQLHSCFPNARVCASKRIAFPLLAGRYELDATVSFKNQLILIQGVRSMNGALQEALL